MSTIGLCRLCLQPQPLCHSHAISSSVFNYILRKNSGKAIVITDDRDTPVQFSSDTWDIELLCAKCEADMNKRYDAYGLAVFRGHEGTTRQLAGGVQFLRIDRMRLRMFFLSVLWRISVSTHPSYSNVELPFAIEEDLRSALHVAKPIHGSRYTVAVYKMRDSTPSNGFSNEALRGFICAPFARDYGDFVSICFLFLGFFVETFFPKVPATFKKRDGVLHGRSPVFVAPYSELFDIPEIMQLLVRGLEKHDTGLSRVT